MDTRFEFTSESKRDSVTDTNSDRGSNGNNDICNEKTVTKTDTATVTVTVTMEIENPDVIIGTETWLNSHIPTCEFFPPSHSVF